MPLPRAILDALGGPPTEVTSLGPRTTRLRGQTGLVVARAADSPRKARQEAESLRAWAPLGRSPRLLGQAGLHLWMSHLEGAPGEAAGPIAHFSAIGALLGAASALECSADRLPLPAAIEARRAALLRGAVDPRVARTLGPIAPEVFAGVARVWAHRDLSPRNWLTTQNNVQLVDFEHSAPDAPGADLARLGLELRLSLGAEDTRARLAAVDAARRQTGGPPVTEAQLVGLARLTAAATLAWGLRHRDPLFIDRGARWIALIDEARGLPW